MGVRPPGVNRHAETWDDLTAFEQAHILAFDQLSEIDRATTELPRCPLFLSKKRS